MKLFLVSRGSRHVLINIPESKLLADQREFVKREAHRYLLGHPDLYVVSPLTHHGDAVFMSLSVGDLHS